LGEDAVDQSSETIAGYTLLAPLGQGTTGTVYKAQHQHININRIVALKTPFRKPDSERSMREERFFREAQALARLTFLQDVNLPTLYDVGGDLDRFYYARELVVGNTLEFLATRSSVNLRKGVQILQTVANVVQRVHACGLAHRNLHPANVLIAEGETPKLIGFGLVGLLEGSDLLPPGRPGVPVAVDVRALQGMLGWLCAKQGQPIPASLEEVQRTGSVASPAVFAGALESYLQHGV
jgi:serine/threonine protein kinase